MLWHLGGSQSDMVGVRAEDIDWAERARAAGYPERFAQEVLGHKSAAVRRAYAKRAKAKIPSLEEYEKKMMPV